MTTTTITAGIGIPLLTDWRLRREEGALRVEVAIRSYRSDDAAALAEVMFRSVREAATADYTAEQVNAWLPARPTPEAADRRARDGRRVLVAAAPEGRILGYIDLQPDGHIDHLFCVPEAVGHGIGARLYDAVERAAADEGLEQLYVEASESARRLLEEKGFVVRERREKELRGVPIHNYAMSKELTSLP
jgi:putative acetyltransferase